MASDVAVASGPASPTRNSVTTITNATLPPSSLTADTPQTLSSSRATSPKPPRDTSRPGTAVPQPHPSQALSAIMDVDDTPSSPERPLNVTDALSYLDSVKIQFQDRPDVYNRFLDIMKDFKSQYIDTPGVIERVSNLFHGHPALIQGFNTFLPAGYRIECTTDNRNPNLITVTTPSGTMFQSANGTFHLDPNIPPPHSHFTPLPSAVPEADMKQALDYLEKVKTRYANDPERYRRFLKLLSPLEAGSSLDDDEFFNLVSRIFEDDSDLMEGFYEFLRDRNVQRQAAAKLDEAQGSSKPRDTETKRRRGEPANAASTSASLPHKRKRKVVERENSAKDKDILVGGKGSNKRTKQGHATAPNSEVPSPSLMQRHAAPLSPRRAAFPHPPHAGPSTVLIPHQAPPSPVGRYDDGQFFDRVKRALNNRETYNEFLKIVNLFTQDMIDSTRLVHKSRSFLGDGELMVQFKEILGYDERRERMVINADEIWTRPTGVLDRPSRNQLHERFGSYRKLPAHETNVLCSGRDDMCKSVLNDEWISQPTFASEDAGFIAHKKNIYEEALHRSEEERHEYDFHLEAIRKTMSMLEPFNNKISQLSPEERQTYKIKNNASDAAKSLQFRIIKKIYGMEPGKEVWRVMQESPAIAIPVVLTRLKQKEEEWKRAQKEWNKIWREVDLRNYAKSLDHQSISWKSQDKKATTPKFFVNQIEVAREEQRAKRAGLVDPLFGRTRPRHQLEYVVEDEEVLRDEIKLVCSFLDRTGDRVGVAERKKIESFLRSFVPVFFMMDPVAFNGSFVPSGSGVDGYGPGHGHEADDGESSVNGNGSSTVHSKTGRGGKRNGAAANGGSDLRKRLLKSEQAKSSRRTRAAFASPSSSRRGSPAVGDVTRVDVEPHVEVRSSSGDTRSSRKGTFYTNTTFYVLIRQLELLYSRLHLFKSIANSAISDPTSYKPVPIAQSLGVLNDLSALGERAHDAPHYYDLFLESCEKLFDNQMEQHVFEDIMRYMFGIKDAYKAFTVDKVIGAIVKQVQSLLADPRSQELYELLRRERDIASPTTQDLINTRKNTEKVLGPDENLFRIDWLPEMKTITIQLLGKDDSSMDDTEVLNGRWQAYIDSYVSTGQTEGVPPSLIARKPFLQRNIRAVSPLTTPAIISRGTLSMRVCVRTYRLFYVTGGEESFSRRRTPRDGREELKERSLAAHEARQRWLEKKKWVGDDEPEEKVKDGASSSNTSRPSTSGRKSPVKERETEKGVSKEGKTSGSSQKSAEGDKKGSESNVAPSDREEPVSTSKDVPEPIDEDVTPKEKASKEKDVRKKSPIPEAPISEKSKDVEKVGGDEDVVMEPASSA